MGMIGTTRILIALLLFVASCVGAASPDRSSDEFCRIRIQNTPGGLVQVSLDGGATYGAVGGVTAPANARIVGFAAASYIPHGTVAATAVHGLRIKTGSFAQGVGKAQMPLMFSITPIEFAKIPAGYGGHIPRSSGILTDIYSGCSIFRNFSPYVGNAVFVERDHRLLLLPEDYTPAAGETFVIIVKRPARPPLEIDFENRSGGAVTAIYPDGVVEAVASVDRAVKGVGRYDGTSFTGVGSVNTNHGGVLTISTAPICPPRTREGGATETRGGFMVQPYYHVAEQGEGAVQVMVIGPKDKSKPALEGTPPLFDGFINLTRFPGRPDLSYRAQVRIDDGPWEDMPQITGRVDDAFSAAYLQEHFAKAGKDRKIEKGVTAIRLLFPEYDPKALANELAREVSEYTRRALGSGIKAVSGTVNIAPSKPYRNAAAVTYYVDGSPVFVSNRRPHIFGWDSTRVPNGFHSVGIDVITGSATFAETRRMLVQN
ncbi:MAG: hypothetical protein M1133_15840 [Armatimonadetes bacterium]|nr:hypothetical protein [Armatimonadota bacterium]